ncbi:response regulator [Aliterella atlantica]|uniref:Response regulatory domain-containing protein n=1 Tax=Aliterella atlantica CENA595 TaxID=1618023 RepID=A0A0D8ZMY6_9CYAN|nr:response regulator [Aliterella atlantica]KJH69819.1 hypothetical protein UH38_21535 [Aliterella atlantica CENA595]
MLECKRVLVVEDNRILRELLIDYLSISGYQVKGLDCGAYFFKTLDDFQPHLILLDLMMPDVDGYALLEQRQQAPQWQNIPVIVLSGLAFNHQQQHALDLGANRYLIKPTKFSTLLKAIQEEIRKYGD